MAARYTAEGADEICYLDIGAAPEERATLLDLVHRTAREVFVPLTVGGGVRSPEDMRSVLRRCRQGGGQHCGGGSSRLDRSLRRRLWSPVRSPGSGRRSSAAGRWEVVVNGGRAPTGRDAIDWIAEGVERGAGEILLTSIDRDGTNNGYDLDLLAAATAVSHVPVIASGGAGVPAHFVDASSRAGVSGVLAASTLHRGNPHHQPDQGALATAGIPVREAA